MDFVHEGLVFCTGRDKKIERQYFYFDRTAFGWLVYAIKRKHNQLVVINTQRSSSKSIRVVNNLSCYFRVIVVEERLPVWIALIC